jgi:hypothetical protein
MRSKSDVDASKYKNIVIFFKLHKIRVKEQWTNIHDSPYTSIELRFTPIMEKRAIKILLVLEKKEK